VQDKAVDEDLPTKGLGMYQNTKRNSKVIKTDQCNKLGTRDWCQPHALPVLETTFLLHRF